MAHLCTAPVACQRLCFHTKSPWSVGNGVIRPTHSRPAARLAVSFCAAPTCVTWPIARPGGRKHAHNAQQRLPGALHRPCTTRSRYQHLQAENSSQDARGARHAHQQAPGTQQSAVCERDRKGCQEAQRSTRRARHVLRHKGCEWRGSSKLSRPAEVSQPTLARSARTAPPDPQLPAASPSQPQNIDTDQIIPAEYLTLVPSKVRVACAGVRVGPTCEAAGVLHVAPAARMAGACDGSGVTAGSRCVGAISRYAPRRQAGALSTNRFPRQIARPPGFDACMHAPMSPPPLPRVTTHCTPTHLGPPPPPPTA
jgi:hypothetical protein